jgi:flavoprotein
MKSKNMPENESTKTSSGKFKLVWGITGAGDLLPETFRIMEEWGKKGQIEITAVLSQAAIRVIKIYRLWETLSNIADKILLEKDANTPFIVGSLQTGKFDALLVAPTTGNSVAKIVHGISDSLITNMVSMTNRTKTHVFLLPVEREGQEVKTTLPDGSILELLTRDLDAANTAKLQNMPGITVLDTPKDIPMLMRHEVKE